MALLGMHEPPSGVGFNPLPHLFLLHAARGVSIMRPEYPTTLCCSRPFGEHQLHRDRFPPTRLLKSLIALLPNMESDWRLKIISPLKRPPIRFHVGGCQSHIYIYTDIHIYIYIYVGIPICSQTTAHTGGCLHFGKQQQTLSLLHLLTSEMNFVAGQQMPSIS